MLKEDALNYLKEGETLFVPTWYISMIDSGKIFATCGHEGCCENDWDNFEEFWNDHGDDERLKVV